MEADDSKHTGASAPAQPGPPPSGEVVGVRTASVSSHVDVTLKDGSTFRVRAATDVTDGGIQSVSAGEGYVKVS